MLKKIAGTTLVRFISALASLIILSMNARVLGPGGLGIISLIVVGIAIIQNISNIIGGSALVYLASRYDNFYLYLLSSLWALISASIGTVIMSLTKTIPAEHVYNVLFLSLLASLINIQQMLLLGHERVKAYNWSSLLQSLVNALALFYFFFIANDRTVDGFVHSLYIAFGVCFLLTYFMIFPSLKITAIEGLVPLVKEIVRLGGSIQIAGLLQTLNYRFSYFLLKKFFGTGTLGRFDAGVKLSEGIWLAAKSIALVEYSRISNESDEQKSYRMAIALFKLSFFITLAGIILLLLLPTVAFEFLLGQGFPDIKWIILSLSPGILAIASGMIFSHLFSGTGKPHYNIIGSGIGLITLIAAGYLFIPKFGLMAAGLVTSFSYLSSLACQIYLFRKMSGYAWSVFIPRRSDFAFLFTKTNRKP
ncbi:MAG TPA: polysaccharide biosynthesis C-terminal domain-containing protein [Bacteroidales bacterium]|mgnify:FL=1|jgi:O-antigen/teichoic acid export membrane protein|nr:oligosaccharide flippase family protein [Bacteroidales bacterium]MDI9574440.1 polysaccharide biosynthesis C-terminal domain-containing protein [Bacteroidota bacterium]MBP9511729.1 oligosaccharide flippase family protein [Bacteroidales bacterium]MBP9588736.1 oligosaccharide flippase family protein [Bacteroidales bacterium]NMD16167.1 oligosaccharide flippase family protein [Bacteroidales bacterium]